MLPSRAFLIKRKALGSGPPRQAGLLISLREAGSIDGFLGSCQEECLPLTFPLFLLPLLPLFFLNQLIAILKPELQLAIGLTALGLKKGIGGALP